MLSFRSFTSARFGLLRHTAAIQRAHHSSPPHCSESTNQRPAQIRRDRLVAKFMRRRHFGPVMAHRLVAHGYQTWEDVVNGCHSGETGAKLNRRQQASAVQEVIAEWWQGEWQKNQDRD